MTPANLYPLIKKLKISQAELISAMGYSRVYISEIMNAHRKSTQRFDKLLVLAIAKRAKKDYRELKIVLKGTDWESYLP